MTATFLDNYSRNARLTPALICAIPVSMALILFGSSISGAVAGVMGAASALGLTALLAQLGRDRGKRKETALFEIWGGKPSVAKMRQANKSINSHTKLRYLNKARELLPEVKWPTSHEELLDPAGADQKYETLSHFLLEHTRDSKRYPLVYAELVNYGFRRNLWGLKVIGLPCAIASLTAVLLKSAYEIHQHTTLSVVSVVVTVCELILVFIWWLWITPSWVRIAADAYAERLLGSLEHIRPENPHGL